MTGSGLTKQRKKSENRAMHGGPSPAVRDCDCASGPVSKFTMEANWQSTVGCTADPARICRSPVSGRWDSVAGRKTDHIARFTGQLKISRTSKASINPMDTQCFWVSKQIRLWFAWHIIAPTKVAGKNRFGKKDSFFNITIGK